MLRGMGNPIQETAATLDTSGFVAAMGAAQQATSKTLETVGMASEGLEALGGVFGVVQAGISKAVEAIAEGLSDAFAQGQQLMQRARQASQSVASIVELNHAFGDAGLSAGDVSTALFSL